MTALVGPLTRVRYANGSEQAVDLPRNTLDPRYVACPSHHPACHCREAMLAEDIGEWRAMYDDLAAAIIAATAGHAVWAYTGHGDVDRAAQCECAACEIRRETFTGYGEFISSTSREVTA